MWAGGGKKLAFLTFICENLGKEAGVIEKKVKKTKSWQETFQHAWEGCFWAFRTQKNFKIHFGLSFLVLALGLWLKVSMAEFLLLLLAIWWGLTIEMANTAIEKLVDLVTEKYHPQAKIAKDVAAGMMLVLSVGLALLGILILLPPLWLKLFKSY